jgi:metal-responsive CopG/Arc/MetJ family transcriptional regulator
MTVTTTQWIVNPMNTQITIELTSDLHEKLQTLLSEGQTDPSGAIAQMITEAYEKRGWLEDLAALRRQILHDGGLQQGDNLVALLHQTRQEIFEAEYAHLY